MPSENPLKDVNAANEAAKTNKAAKQAEFYGAISAAIREALKKEKDYGPDLSKLKTEEGRKAVLDYFFGDIKKPYADVVGSAPEGRAYGEMYAIQSRFGFTRKEIKAILEQLKDALDVERFEQAVQTSTGYRRAMGNIQAPVDTALDEVDAKTLMDLAGIKGPVNKVNAEARQAMYKIISGQKNLTDILNE